MALPKLSHLLIGAFVAILGGCSGTDTADETKKLEGTRYKVNLVRAVDVNEWVNVTGTQEWWFFAGNAFRQISVDYVEPQFYGANQSCSGSGSGTYELVEVESRRVDVTLKYDGVNELRGLCRMTDRVLEITLQPSGVVDMVDHKRVQRLERMEDL